MPTITQEMRDHADEMQCEVCEGCGEFYNATPANVDNGHDCGRSLDTPDSEAGA